MIVTINHSDFGHCWTMTFDLEFICENAGKRVKDDDGTYTPLTIPHTRKIFKLIRQYKDDCEDIDEYLKKYPRLLEIWKKVSA